MAGSKHDRAVTSFDQRSRTILTNGGTVVGGNGATYKYDPLSGKAVVVKFGAAKPPANKPGNKPTDKPGNRPVGSTPAAPGQPPAPGAPQPGDGRPDNRPAKGPMTPGERAGQPAPTGGAQSSPDTSAEDAAKAEADRIKREADEKARRNAYELLLRQFREYGLEELGPLILDYLIQGYDGNTISLMLQDSEPYKKRFAGNEQRRKNGLAVLSPAEYLQLERSYEQIMRSNGLPPGFYDDKSDFTKFIGQDISPNEVNDRVQGAIRFINDTNPEYRAALAAYYPELGTGDLAANFLDPERALPIIQKKVRAVEIGGAAARQGLRMTDRVAAEQYADQGVTGEQANAAYGEIANLLPTTRMIGDRFKERYEQTDAEQELLGGLASARRKRERLYRSETSLFAGSGGVASGSLGRDNSGSF